MKDFYLFSLNRLLTGVVFLLSFSTTHAQISGTVYRDFDASGTQTLNLPTEPGVPRVTVNAYVNFSTTPISVTTDAAGGYAFSAGQIPPQAKVRIEFATIDEGFFFGPVGPNSQTNLRFVSAPAANVNCGVNYPTEYCQNGEVQIVMPCFVNGNPLTTTNANGPVDPANQAARGDVLVSFSIDATGLASAANFPPTHLASASDIGAVWGVAYLRTEKKVLSSATIKRHAGLGSLGTGGIYITDLPTATSAPFFDFQADLGIPTGADPHSGLNPDKTQPSSDPGPMSTIGKIGLGGIDLSDDSKTLYAVNMFDRKLYGVFIDSPARKPGPSDVKSWPIDQSGCPNGDFRPWAIYNYRKHVYIGGVCSGENRTSKISQSGSAMAAMTATLPDTAGLKAIIMRIDPRQGAAATFQTVLSFPLTFERGSSDMTDDCRNFKYWLPWNSDFPMGCNSTGQFVVWPQPMVTDLAFDDNGDMIIGMLDRFGHLAGVQNYNPAGQGSYNGFTGGDILRASLIAPNNSAYRLESNGSVGGRTAGSNTIPGSGQSLTPPYNPVTGTYVVAGVGNSQGPGGGEFYFNDQWYFNVAGQPGHNEITNGSLMLRPGSNEIMTSVFDPITDVYQSGGVRVMSNLDGTLRRNYALFGFNAPGTFGKVSGLGDGKILCDPAPIEIGNRVWFDDNRDGIQDAYEPGVDGIVLRLFDMGSSGTGTLVASTTTANGGLYVFNNSNVPTGMKVNQNYQVRMDVAQLPSLDLSASTPQGGPKRNARRATVTRDYYISPQTQGTAVGSSTRDSDATIIGSDAVISLTTGSFGENNYNYDLSVYSCPSVVGTIETLSVCADAGTIPEIPVTGLNFSQVDDLRFVYFSTPQSGTAMYTGGQVLATFTPTDPTSYVTSLTAPAIPTANPSGAPIEYYVYGIIYPTPADPRCRVASLSKLTVLPKPAISALTASATLTCGQPTVVLAAKNPTPRAQYVWLSPPGSTSTASSTIAVSSPGVYTLTSTLDGCAGDAVTATVSDDKLTASVTVPGAEVSCSSPVASLTALVNQVISAYPVLWSGPANFTSTANPLSTSVVGLYTATVTFPNGCTAASATVDVKQGANTPPFIAIDIDGLSNILSTTLTCAKQTATLSAENPTAGAIYVWKSPVAPTSVTATSLVVSAPGVYTLTGSLSGCPGEPRLVTVLDDKGVGTVLVNNATLTCSTTMVTLTASVDGVKSPYPVRWTGPASFTSNSNPINVTTAGLYTAYITFPNGCTVASGPTTGSVTQGDLTLPFVDAIGGAKQCPTCSVTLAADASGVSFFWTGPNSFTSTEQFPVVQTEGLYKLTVTDLISGCSDFIEVVVEGPTNDPCPVLTISTASLTVCSADQVSSVTVTASQSSPFGPNQQVQFVKFTSPQSGTAMYTGGTILSTVTPTNATQVVLLSSVLAPYLATTTAQTFYIYAIISPTPAQVIGQPDCRPAVALTVTVRPTECVPIQATRIR
ncbi:SdrD B-like domain-containing protein [uncultured Fibrella sp.]|uniref:SdrD B-like domain-containing protein n=1 Tax=uncultured Fibrella sp. TaxID=1284596 RepID=UPI0035CA34B5